MSILSARHSTNPWRLESRMPLSPSTPWNVLPSGSFSKTHAPEGNSRKPASCRVEPRGLGVGRGAKAAPALGFAERSQFVGQVVDLERVAMGAGLEDRKSTRLNSSH